MKNMMKNVLAGLVLVGFIFMSVTTGAAKNVNQTLNFNLGDQDFTLINSTGVEINALYVTPHNSKEWGEDILGVDTLDSGKEVSIEFPNKIKSKIWDLRVEDEDGNYIEWDNLNLIKISTVELLYKNKNATALLN